MAVDRNNRLINIGNAVAELRALYEKAGVSSTSTNIVYCRTGMQASMTYFVLKFVGRDAILYDGSFEEWSRHTELPVEKSDGH